MNTTEALKTLISCPNCRYVKPNGDLFYCWREGIEEVYSHMRCQHFQFNNNLKKLWEQTMNNNL
ncbi:MAG: hypothetical protein LBF69_00465 [Prevotellaceae bacterium]|jgi:hypothetical protein|nr:hypothetical protein [Prevotellaceae bacterium]